MSFVIMTKEEQHALAFGRFASGVYAQAHRQDVAVMAFWSLERREGLSPSETCDADRRLYDNELECGHG